MMHVLTYVCRHHVNTMASVLWMRSDIFATVPALDTAAATVNRKWASASQIRVKMAEHALMTSKGLDVIALEQALKEISVSNVLATTKKVCIGVLVFIKI